MTRGRRGQSLDLNKISCWSWSMKYCSFVDLDPKHFQSTRTHTSGGSRYSFDRVSSFYASIARYLLIMMGTLSRHSKSFEMSKICWGKWDNKRCWAWHKNKQTKREKPCRKVGGKQQWVWRSLPAYSRSAILRYNRTNDTNGIFVTS